MHFDPEKSLFDLPATKSIAITTVLLFTISILTILLSSRIYFDPSYQGFNTAVEIFKVPLGILAVGLSLIGICGANHRSEQTKRQIERTTAQITLTKSQNNFANYYKHIEEFEKYCAKISDDRFSIKETRELYRILYPTSKDGNFQTSPEVVRLVAQTVDDFLGNTFNFQMNSKLPYALKNLVLVRNVFREMFRVSENLTENHQGEFKINNQTYRLFDTSYGLFVLHYSKLILFVDKIFHFDINYQSPEQIPFLKTVDISGYRMRRLNVDTPEPFEFAEVFGPEAFKYVVSKGIDKRALEKVSS